MSSHNNIEGKRHSLAHLLAAAVMDIWPDTKRTIGPAIENGFYFDFEFSRPVSEEDFPKIEAKMREILPTWTSFERHELSPEDAKKEYPNNPYKHELIDEFSQEGKTLSFYKSGDYWDLCKGGHSENPAKELHPKAFKLEKVAGAYWRGNEKNKMLTRIYGLAFDTEEELIAYEKMMEEAKKRDHRELGKKLELFAFSDEIGPGLPVWLPNGTVLRDVLEALAKKKERLEGYQRVSTPVITKESLFIKSGHLPHYRDSMYSPMDIDGENYYIKPMNCPFHHTVYLAKPRSYRELPLRLAEYGLCHRYEKSGELQGLMRVRSLMMNDAHIYVRPDQVGPEIKRVIELHEFYYKLFDIKKISYRLSLHDKNELGKKYVDMPEAWETNEKILRNVLQELGSEFYEGENEAAFYGPKIDIQIQSAIGKEYTIGTVQLDFAQPMKFNLRYVNETGQEVMPYVIHRAPLGTHERFIGFLIEHYAGAFPIWLAPEQVRVLPVSDKFMDYARRVQDKLIHADVRTEMDDSNETLGKKIRNAEMMKIPHMVVVGEKEVQDEKVTVRLFATKEQKEYKLEEYLAELQELIKLPV